MPGFGMKARLVQNASRLLSHSPSSHSGPPLMRLQAWVIASCKVLWADRWGWGVSLPIWTWRSVEIVSGFFLWLKATVPCCRQSLSRMEPLPYRTLVAWITTALPRVRDTSVLSLPWHFVLWVKSLNSLWKVDGLNGRPRWEVVRIR